MKELIISLMIWVGANTDYKIDFPVPQVEQMGTIMDSKKIVLMANGKHKKDILDKAMNGEVTEDVPASILQKHNNVEVYYCD